MRLFIALWPDPAARAALAGLQRRLGDEIARAGGWPVPAENLHLTLAFLGEMPKARVAPLAASLASLRVEPFAIEIERTGSFPASQVLWAGPTRVPPELDRTRRRVLLLLSRAGLTGDAEHPDSPDHPFVPHITLARGLARPLAPAAPPPVSWCIRWFVQVPRLVCSDGSGGARSYRLVDPCCDP
jgi:2'-5' RNA ligase